MAYKDLSIDEFITVLASKAPTPGGGGASALCGAIGMALGSMVSNLTIGKKTYAAVEEEMLLLRNNAEKIQQRFLSLIDEDEKAFQPLAAAYRLPADTEEEKQHKDAVLEQCSKDACGPAFEIILTCSESLKIIDIFAEKGSKLAVSDAGCAAILTKSAMQSAALNVFINTKSMKDREYADKLNKNVQCLLEQNEKKADEIYHSVLQKLL